MSTRSCVAVPDIERSKATGTVCWRGRYVHSDGYPSGVGRELQRLVLQHGYQAVARKITIDRYGWSYLNAEQQGDLHRMHSDGRFAAEAGFGVAYTTVQNQSSPDEWITDADGADEALWIEWVYVLGESSIGVLETYRAGKDADGEPVWGWRPVGQVRYDDAEGMAALEAKAMAEDEAGV